MNNIKFFVFLLISIFTISLVSAGWFTGNAVKAIRPENSLAVGTVIDNVDNTHVDSDEGVFPSVAGLLAVYDRGPFKNPTLFYDKCGRSAVKVYDSEGKRIKGAYKVLREYYYDDVLGKPAYIDFTSEELGEGYCLREKKSIFGIKKSYGSWVSTSSVCAEIREGVFRDESGDVKKSGCQGINFIEYGCSDDNRTIEEVSNVDCSVEMGEYGKCSSGGCTGSCEDTTDSTNDIDVAGVAILDLDKLYFDECSADDKKVKQYYCKNGVVKTQKYGDSSWKSCGSDRVCVIDNETVIGAGKCVSKVAAVETTTLEGLRRIVESLQQRISVLEAQLV